jgi:hypothetical protein
MKNSKKGRNIPLKFCVSDFNGSHENSGNKSFQLGIVIEWMASQHFSLVKGAEDQFKKEILTFLFWTYLNYDCSTDAQFCVVNWSAQAVKGEKSVQLIHKDNIAYAPKLKGWTIIVKGII